MGTTIPCQDQTHERLEELRGDQYKNWDAFLNHLADIWEKRDTEPTGGELALEMDMDVFEATKKDIEEVKDLVDRVPGRTADRIREDFQ